MGLWVPARPTWANAVQRPLPRGAGGVMLSLAGPVDAIAVGTALCSSSRAYWLAGDIQNGGRWIIEASMFYIFVSACERDSGRYST